jgi:DNA-binding NarL/FixJ family response regulator
MKTQGTNLFIVDDNELVLIDLKYYLINKFGANLQISTFSNGESCLEKIDAQTDIVILDYFLEGKNGLEVLKSIKDINPKTEVIMFTSNENTGMAIESFRTGAKDYVIKGRGSINKIYNLVYHIITEPIRMIVREFGVSKYVAIFLMTFVTMGLVVYFVLVSMKP